MKTPLRFLVLFTLFVSVIPHYAMVEPQSQGYSHNKVVTSPYTLTTRHPKGLKARLLTWVQKKIIAASLEKPLSTDKTISPKKKRILKAILWGGLALLAIYFLQGTIWLTIVGLISLFTYLLRHRSKNRPPVNPYPIIVQSRNHYAKKGLRAFLWGLGTLILAFLTIFLAIISEAALFSLILLLGLALISTILFSVAIGRAVKSLRQKEEDTVTPIIVLVLSILFLLPLLLFFVGFLTSGF